MDGYVYIYDQRWDIVRISKHILAILYFQLRCDVFDRIPVIRLVDSHVLVGFKPEKSSINGQQCQF